MDDSSGGSQRALLAPHIPPALDKAREEVNLDVLDVGRVLVQVGCLSRSAAPHLSHPCGPAFNHLISLVMPDPYPSTLHIQPQAISDLKQIRDDLGHRDPRELSHLLAVTEEGLRKKAEVRALLQRCGGWMQWGNTPEMKKPLCQPIMGQQAVAGAGECRA